MSRRVLVLAAGNLVLLALLAMGLVLRGADVSQERLFLDVDPSSVQTIALSPLTDVILALRDDGDWQITTPDGSFPARSDRIGALLSALAESRVTRTISTRDSATGELGLADEARSISLGIDGQTVIVDVGTRLQTGTTVAVDPVSGDIVEVNGALDFYLRQTVSFWAYLRLLPESVRADEVVGVRIAEAGETDAREVRPEAARSLADLVGDGFFDGSSAGPRIAAVTVELRDQRSFVIAFAADGDRVVAVPSGPALPGGSYGGLAYTIAPETFERLAVLLEISPAQTSSE